MNDERKRLKELYNNLKADNYDLPEYGTFESDMADDNLMRQLYDNIKADNYDVPDYETFRGDMGYGSYQQPAEQQQPTAYNPATFAPMATMPQQQAPNVRAPFANEEAQRQYEQQRAAQSQQQPKQEQAQPLGPERFQREIEGQQFEQAIANVEDAHSRFLDNIRKKHQPFGNNQIDVFAPARQQRIRKEQKYNSRVQLDELKGDIDNRIAEIQNQATADWRARDEKRGFWERAARSLADTPDKTGGVAEETARMYDEHPELRELTAASRSIRNAMQVIGEADHNAKKGTFESSWFAGLGRGFSQKLSDVRTWDMGLTDVQDNAAILKALEAFDRGEQLTESQQALLDAKAIELCVNEYFGSEVGRGYKAGATTAESIPFMIEMVANPLLSAGKGATRLMARYAVKRFGKEAAKKVGRKIFRGAIRGVVDVVGSAAGTATTGAIGTYAGTLDRMIGDLQYDTDKDGNVVFSGHENMEDPLTALGKEFSSQTIERWSEMAGVYNEFVPKVLGKLMGKGLNKIGLGAVTNFFERVPKTQWGKAIGNFMERTQWHGPIGEFLEEIEGGTANALMNIDQTLDANPDTGVFNKDNLIDTFEGVAVMGVMFAGAGTLGYVRGRANLRKADKKADLLFGNYWPEIRDLMTNGSYADRHAIMEKILSDPTASEEQKEALLEYDKWMLANALRENVTDRVYADPSEMAAGVSFDNGYFDADTEEKRYDAYISLGEKENAVRTLLGEETFKRLEDAPIDVQNELEKSGNLTDEQRKAIADYVAVKYSVEGIEQRINDDADMMAAQQREEAKVRTNKNDGAIHPATLKETDANGNPKEVYVVDGDFQMDADGNISGSDVIVVYDPVEGKNREISPMEIASLGEVTSAEQQEENIEANKQAYKQQQMDAATGRFNPQPGQQIEIPNAGTATVMATDGETVTLQMPDGTQQSMAIADIQKIADGVAMEDYRQRHPEAVESGERRVESAAPEGAATEQTTSKIEGVPEEFVPGMTLTVTDREGNEHSVTTDGKRYTYNPETGELTESENGNYLKLTDENGEVLTYDLTGKGYGSAQEIKDYEIPKEEQLTETVEPTEPPTAEVPTRKGHKQIERAKKDLAEADDALAKANAIQNFWMNVDAGAEATEEEKAAFDNAKKELEADGYEIYDLKGKDYKEGMRGDFDFVIDESLPTGTRKITRVSKPLVFKDGKMVQAPKATVTQSLFEDEADVNKAIEAARGGNADAQATLDRMGIEWKPTDPMKAPMPMRTVTIGKGKDKQDVEEPDFMATTAQRGHQYIYNEKGYPREVADEMVQTRHGNAAKTLDELTKSEPKMSDSNIGGSMALYDKIHGEWQAKKEAAEQEVKYWEDVMAEQQKAIAAEQAALKAQQQAQKEAEQGVPDMSVDKASDARRRGYRVSMGNRFDRQEPVQGVTGSETEIKFSDNDKVKGTWKVVESQQVQPSHMRGQRNPLHFITEAQPKDRTDDVSDTTSDKIAKNINPKEITEGVTAYVGAPIINSRGEVIQGNNRAIALKKMAGYPESAAKYKQYLIDHAAEFGLNADEIAKMENPVLVREADVTDEEAIRLGQFTANDTESGGKQRMSAGNILGQLDEQKTKSLFNLLLETGESEEDMTLDQIIDRNGTKVMTWLNRNGVINATQTQSAYNSKGQMTPEAKNDLKDLITHHIFKGGSDAIGEAWGKLPVAAQKALAVAMAGDLQLKPENRVLPYVQNAIMAAAEIKGSPLAKDANGKEPKTAEEWRRVIETMNGQTDMYQPVPIKERYNELELDMAVKFLTIKQKALQAIFEDHQRYITGGKKQTAQTDMFGNSEEVEQPMSNEEAIEKAFGVKLNTDNNGNIRRTTGGVEAGGEARGGNVGLGEGRAEAAEGGQPGTAAEQPAGEVAEEAPEKGASPIGNQTETPISNQGEGSIEQPKQQKVDNGAFEGALSELEDKGISIDSPELLDKYGLKNVTLEKRGNHVTLTHFISNEQGKGNGTRFMQDLTEIADRNGWTLALTPDDSFGATSVKRLKDFYKRFGFKDNKGRNSDFETRESMVRQPQTSERDRGLLEVVMDKLRNIIGDRLHTTLTEDEKRMINWANAKTKGTAPVFYSNAERAVEGIKQEKATAEQWLAMIQKAGGLKAGEDKWMGLSDWLNDHKGKSLTKQEVLDFIRDNQIQMQEVNYEEGNNRDLQNLANRINDRAEELEMQGLSDDELHDRLLEEFPDMDNMIDDGRLVVEDSMDGGYILRGGVEKNEINPTRLNYTTDFLDNKKEIAFVVPNIESWHDTDEVHFGDAGEGRAVMWVRFGDTTISRKPTEKDVEERVASMPKADQWEKVDGSNFVSKKDVYFAPGTRNQSGHDYIVDNNGKYVVEIGNSRKYLTLPFVKEGYDTIDEAVNAYNEWKAKQEKVNTKILVIDEIQSNRHQEGREKGYKDNSKDKAMSDYTAMLYEKYGPQFNVKLTEEEDAEYSRLQRERMQEEKSERVPDAPFEKNWHEVAMKRMLRYAAENGYDKVAWTTGEQQAKRYNLSQKIKEIAARADGNGNYYVVIEDKDGQELMDYRGAGKKCTAEEVVNLLGKDLGSRLIDGAEQARGKEWSGKGYNPEFFTIKENGLEFGGEGMKGFYDQILPRFIDKYGKKWGVKTTDVELPNVGDNGLTMHSVEVTPEMKKSVLEGQPMFFRTPSGEVYGFTVGGNIYVDMDIAKADTPIHEYGHLWVPMVRESDPEMWEDIKSVLTKDKDVKPFMDIVRQRYPELTAEGREDDFMEEVFTHFSGDNGLKMLEEAAREYEEQDGQGFISKAKAIAALNKVKEALNKFWGKVAQLFGIKFRNAREVANKMFKDFMDEVDPTKVMRERTLMNPRTTVPNVRGGWNERKIKDYLKHNSTRSGVYTAARAISEFDNVDELKDHMFYHGTVYGGEKLKPSITMSERDAERYGGGGYGERYWGISLTKSKRVASNFSGMSNNIKIYPVILLKGAKVIERPDFEDAADLNDHIVELWNDGVDAVWIGKGKQGEGEQELCVINPRAVVNIGTPDFYNVYQLGTEENPLRIADDAAIKKMYETAKEYASFPKPNKPFKPIKPSNLKDNLEWKSDDEYAADMEAYEQKLADYEQRMDEYNNSEELRKYEEMQEKARKDIRFQKADNKSTEREVEPYKAPKKNDGEDLIDYAKRVAEDYEDYKKNTSINNEDNVPRVQARDAYERSMGYGANQFKEAVQDSMLSLKELYRAILGENAKIEDVKGYENAYLAENRMHSASEAQAHAYQQDFMVPIVDAIYDLIGHGKFNKEKYDDLVDYMMAKHGLERNRVFAERDAQAAAKKGADYNEELQKNQQRDYAGLTALTGESDVATAEAMAQKMVDDYEANHDTTALWEKINRATKQSLYTLYSSGMMTKERYEQIRDMFDYYIPLQGFDSTVAEDVYAYLGSDGTLGYGTPIRTARGRKSKADDPIATIAMNGEAAIRSANRNEMKKNFLNFVQNHPSDLVSVSDVWLKYNDVTGEWEQVTADLQEGDSPADVERKTKAFDEKMEQLSKSAPDHYKRSADMPNVPYRVVQSGNMKQHQVTVKRNGKDYVLTINGNPRAAQALNGLTNPDVFTEGVFGKFMNLGQWLNRQLSAFYTTRNPEFVLSNFLRDAIYSNMMVGTKEDGKYAMQFHKNFGKMNPVSMGKLFAAWENGSLREKVRQGTCTETERMFYDFMMNGGETGWTNMRDIEKHKKEIQNALKMEGSTNRKAWKALGSAFDLMNRSVENCARFAAFVTSREMGRSLERSIWDAKEISVNFNKKGAGDKFLNTSVKNIKKNVAEGDLASAANDLLAIAGQGLGGLGRGLYVFWNASVQGLNNIARGAKKNPWKFVGKIVATNFLLGALMPILNEILTGGDDDDENSYYNLPEYIRRSNICFRFSKNMPWITIPLPIEFRAIYGLGELATGMLTGKERYNDEEFAKQFVSQLSQVLPLDFMEGGGGWHAFIPSQLKPFVEAQNNKSWTGLPIYKDTPFNKNDPEWTKAYKSANKQLVEATKWLNDITNGSDYAADEKKGWIDINPAKLEYMLKGYFGGYTTMLDRFVKTAETVFGDRDFEWRNIPMASRVLREGDERTANRKLTNEYFDLLKEYDETKSIEKKKREKAESGDYIAKADYVAYTSFNENYKKAQVIDNFKPLLDALHDEKKNQSEYSVVEIEERENELRREMVDLIHSIQDAKKGQMPDIETPVDHMLDREMDRHGYTSKAAASRIASRMGGTDGYGHPDKDDKKGQVYFNLRDHYDLRQDVAMQVAIKQAKDAGDEDLARELNSERNAYNKNKEDFEYGAKEAEQALQWLREEREQTLEYYKIPFDKRPKKQ